MKIRISYILVALCMMLCLSSCYKESSDDVQQNEQERILREGTSQIGMPAVKNFRERRILKDIIELRDQTGLITYAYLFSEYHGKFIFVGETVGYPIPYATQYTNPEKMEWKGHNWGFHKLPQADPSGLFSPASAEGTWILMRNPVTNKVEPQYVEQRLQVFTFELPSHMVMGRSRKD
jgi:hypothetical protein